MNFRSYLIAAALTSFVASSAGCGTFFGRTNGHAAVYPGLQQDAAFLGVTGVNEPYNPSGAATILCYMSIVCVPVTLLSIPIDAAIDTVLLPIDLINTSESMADIR